LHATTKDYERNVASIVHSLEPWIEAEEDSDITTVRVGRNVDFVEVVGRVLEACELEVVEADVVQAISEVESEYLEYQESKETIVEKVKVVVPSVKKEKSVRYIGIVLDDPSVLRLKSAILSTLEREWPSAVVLYNSLKSTGRGLHVTLALNPDISSDSTNTRLFLKYLDMIESDVAGTLDVEVDVLESVWDERVMCVTVDCGEIECCNEDAHCTVGVFGDAKGSESNLLLRGEGKCERIGFTCPFGVSGRIRAVKY
jgi:tRNA splicing ligase